MSISRGAEWSKFQFRSTFKCGVIYECGKNKNKTRDYDINSLWFCERSLHICSRHTHIVYMCVCCIYYSLCHRCWSVQRDCRCLCLHDCVSMLFVYLYTGAAMPSRKPSWSSGMKALSRSIISLGVSPRAFSCVWSHDYHMTSHDGPTIHCVGTHVHVQHSSCYCKTIP